jgi:two-component system response regulator AgrA
MLKFILCDSSESDAVFIRRVIKLIAEKKEYDISFELISYLPSEVQEYISENEGLFVYILETSFGFSEIDGVELAKFIREKDRDSYILFCSKDKEYILKVMTALIRPSGFVIKRYNEGGGLEKLENMQLYIGDIYRDYLNVTQKENVLHINVGPDIYKIEYDQIMYVESFQKKIYIWTKNQRIGYYDKLSSLEEKLGEGFFRCHRSYIVNLNNISKVNFPDMVIEMKNKAKIPISRAQKNGLREILKKYESNIFEREFV